ncbi:unnamed protein product [Trifolium pratense]|uniref:Uncharacterized protein n=1 Tax=Trifolium pratense TaxID=57577 RepID=A0ACB0LPI3_TRIPR|nr:unnamed protein product [Trifolium pratense]
MNILRLENFPRLQILPEWIEGVAETLQTLIIVNIPMLRKLPECLAGMTCLKSLIIADCPLLDYLPSGMKYLTALEALTIDGCPKLCRKCQSYSGHRSLKKEGDLSLATLIYHRTFGMTLRKGLMIMRHESTIEEGDEKADCEGTQVEVSQ